MGPSERARGTEKENNTRNEIYEKRVQIFSKGERGKFYRPDVELNLPVYLDPDVAAFLRELAERKGTDIENVVNDWLRKSIDLVQSAK